MTREELLYKWFSSYETLCRCLATYDNKPAIFYQIAPNDLQHRWKESQYPRIIYTLDLQANQERKSVGILNLDLYCDEVGTLPEQIEPLIKECLRDLIVKPSSSSPYCFAWSRTDGFEISSKREKGADTRIYGMEIQFDILEYPSQETTDPDPIVALNRYIKDRIRESFVLGLDPIADFKVAGSIEPVFYCRLEGVELDRETNAVVWMNGKLSVHVLCSDQTIRLKYMMALANSLSYDGEVIMLDKSPMTVKRLQVNNQADYLKEGQLYITVHYGLLRYVPQPHKLQQIHIDFS